jgi:hypothetical protein
MDDWEEIAGEVNAVYSFINGVENEKLHFLVRADSLMGNEEVCTGYSDYKTIDTWITVNPTITSYGTELCEEGDSVMLHISYSGEWDRIEWYLDGDLVADSNTDTIYGDKTGMWTVTAYPEVCPSIPHSSGLGPVITIMDNAEIAENDTIIYALPLSKFQSYNYQWYVDDKPIDPDTMENPGYLYKSQLIPGTYIVEVTNPSGCKKISGEFVWSVTSVADKPSASDLHVYPNPVSDILYLELPEVIDGGYLEIYSLTGVMVRKVEITHNSMMVRMDDLDSGIYLIMVDSNDQQRFVRRVMKK